MILLDIVPDCVCIFHSIHCALYKDDGLYIVQCINCTMYINFTMYKLYNVHKLNNV